MRGVDLESAARLLHERAAREGLSLTDMAVQVIESAYGHAGAD